MLLHHEISIRVRYQETDGQGHVHHANYFTYFEQGRVELMRAAGHSYRDLEASGLMLVVKEISCEYLAPAHYDDVLTLRTTTRWAKGARIEHGYEVLRGEQVVARGRSVIACLNSQGRATRLPEYLRLADGR
jgi:acyl-CoA thioester hydrolase